MEKKCENEKWIRAFEKPKTNMTKSKPDTTALSAYFSLGCVSVRTFFHELERILKKGPHSEPPTSLQGQLLWREFYYMHGLTTKNFDKMVGNPNCR
jgi:cryptochrome